MRSRYEGQPIFSKAEVFEDDRSRGSDVSEFWLIANPDGLRRWFMIFFHLPLAPHQSRRVGRPADLLWNAAASLQLDGRRGDALDTSIIYFGRDG